VATPIGNLSDITGRVKQVLELCDFILAEDTRVTIKLLNHFSIQKRMLSCHDFNEDKRAELLAEAAGLNQVVALVSDAGTPLVSDPGHAIVQAAIAHDMEVIPIPGPSAFLIALIGSGLPCDRFIFEGFLPDKPSAIRKQLAELVEEDRTSVFYVSPHKIVRVLNLILEVLGDRPICLARELTKMHEEFLRGSVSAITTIVEQRQVLGECVLVVAGAQPDPKSSDVIAKPDEIAKIYADMKQSLSEGKGVKEISHECAKKFGWKRSKMYELLLRLKEEPSEERQPKPNV
jgi:16S rRNA (cytidine1402-2'-O)-methyltransferase